MSWFRWLLVWGLGIGLGLEAKAQVAAPDQAVPARALRSVSPTDTTFADLEFLRTEIGGARVVFLGEPTHGEGNVLAAKARLAAFLQQRLGFTTLGIESGFYSLHKAQRQIALGKSVSKNLESSIFPIWMRTREFQAVAPLVGQEGLHVMGFDPQLSGEYSTDLVDDLDDFLSDEKGSDAVNYDLLDEIISYQADHFAFPPSRQPAELEAELAKADKLLAKAAAAPTAARRNEALFWQQCLRSLRALARDYAAHDPSAKTEAEWVAADSNPRDAQMAENLLWYLRQHPAEKVICWGALPHFANRVEVLGSEELRAYRPMGRAVKEALGANQVYILGTLAGGGTHGLPGTAGVAVPEPAAGTLEASLLALNSPYAFMSLKHDAPGRQLTTYAFDYQPIAGPWSEVVDGFLFLRSVAPPHLAATDGEVERADTILTLAAVPQPPGSLNPAPNRTSTTLRRGVSAPDVSGVRLVRGVVLDQRTRAAVPYAMVLLPGQGKGTTTDANGRFALPLPGPTKLQIRSLGYEIASVQSPVGNEELTVQLAPAAYALDEVRVATAPPDPVAILKNVIKNIPTNYEQQDYATEVYRHERITNFDTLRYEAESVNRLRVPAGYRHFTRGFLGHEDGVDVQVQQKRVLTARKSQASFAEVGVGSQGSAFSTADPVRISPLFVARNLRKFTLKLDSVRQQGGETLYVLSFAANQANHRSTGTYLAGVYQGRLLVQKRDYAVVHYEALWQLDTATYNSVARKSLGKTNLVAQIYTEVFSADRSTHVVDYSKGENGRYYARRSIGVTQTMGRALRSRKPFYYQSLMEMFFRPLSEAGSAPTPPVKGGPRPPEVPYRPEFWDQYQRPSGALAPAATK
jgi:erythromycin esterase-like protein